MVRFIDKIKDCNIPVSKWKESCFAIVSFRDNAFHHTVYACARARVCVCVCVRARACVCVCVCACVRVWV
jgi:hypothetical protein